MSLQSEPDSVIAGFHPAQLFHVGVVAVDIDAAMKEMSESLGVTWKGGRPATMNLTVFGEDREIEMRIAHTVQASPHIELIQAVAGTPWDPAKPGVHHLCYWFDDPAPVAARLEAAGRRVLGKVGSPGGYFQSPSGMIVEIIGRELRDHLSGWLTKKA